MALTVQSEALTTVKNLPAVRDLPVTADDDFLNQLLVASSATVGPDGAEEGGTSYPAETRIYRHYYVAARYLEILRSQHVLSKAGNNTFTNLATPIASLMALQSAQDSALGLLVPAGYEATSEQPTTSTATSPNFSGFLIGSGSTKTKLYP